MSRVSPVNTLFHSAFDSIFAHLHKLFEPANKTKKKSQKKVAKKSREKQVAKKRSRRNSGKKKVAKIKKKCVILDGT